MLEFPISNPVCLLASKRRRRYAQENTKVAPSMVRLNLINAETLCWIARLGTFTAAAEHLHTTQSAVSARMRELEQSLGSPLFERRGRRLELTLPARRFVERVEPLLQALEEVLIDPDAMAATAGTVRIGLGEISMTWFSMLIPHLRKALPRVSFQIEMHLAIKLKRMLEEGKLDLAIVASKLDDERFVGKAIGTTRMIWVMSSALAYDADGTQRTLEDLLQHVPLWCVARPSSFFPGANRMLRDAGANLENVCTCNRLEGLIALIDRGEGIGQIPEVMVADQIASGKLVSLTGHLDAIELEFTIARHRDQQQAIVRRIMNTVIDMSQTSLGPPRHID